MKNQITAFQLYDFVRESNRIEGIVRDPFKSEIIAHKVFLQSGPTISALTQFVATVQPDARLRNLDGLNVVVGKYRPPEGGPYVELELKRILARLHEPYLVHQAYEALHPFTDGNGRSGRALWLWMMGGIDGAPLGFLHHWYYQSLRHQTSVPL